MKSKGPFLLLALTGFIVLGLRIANSFGWGIATIAVIWCFGFSLAIGLLFGFLFKGLPAIPVISVVMFTAASVIIYFFFPWDLRPVLTLEIPGNYAGNVYYFQSNEGYMVTRLDNQGCFFIPKSNAADQRIEVYFGDDVISEEELKSKAKLKFIEVNEDATKGRIAFGCLAIRPSQNGYDLDTANNPLLDVRRLRMQGHLKQVILIGQ
jgi:hypothetical protein